MKDLTKKEILAHWNALEANKPLNPQPIAYKHQGSTFNEDSIRLTGSREFIDSILSRLKDLLAFDNNNTRLQLIYKVTRDFNTKEPTGSWNCYIQVHQRGEEAKIANAIMQGMKDKVAKASADTDTETAA